MDNLPLNEFRRQVGEYVNQTYYAGKAFTLLKGERKVAALLPIALVDRLAELEVFYAQTIQSRQDQEMAETEINPSNTTTGEGIGAERDEVNPAG